MRVLSSALRLGESRSVPSSVFTIQPRIYLVVFQSPSPWSAFFRLTKSFVSLGREGKISLMARRVSSETRCCCVLSPLCRGQEVVHIHFRALEASGGRSRCWRRRVCIYGGGVKEKGGRGV